MSYDPSISRAVHMSQQGLCVQVPKEFSVPLVLPCKDPEGPISLTFLSLFSSCSNTSTYCSTKGDINHTFLRMTTLYNYGAIINNNPELLSQNNILQEESTAIIPKSGCQGSAHTCELHCMALYDF